MFPSDLERLYSNWKQLWSILENNVSWKLCLHILQRPGVPTVWIYSYWIMLGSLLNKLSRKACLEFFVEISLICLSFLVSHWYPVRMGGSYIQSWKELDEIQKNLNTLLKTNTSIKYWRYNVFCIPL